MPIMNRCTFQDMKRVAWRRWLPSAHAFCSAL